jgi:hypothetical protein
VAILEENGQIQYQEFDSTQVGVCLQKGRESVQYTTIIGVFIVIFAIILIAISIYCLCTQCLTGIRSDSRRTQQPHGRGQGQRIQSFDASRDTVSNDTDNIVRQTRSSDSRGRQYSSGGGRSSSNRQR